MAIEGPFRGMREIVLSLKRMQELDLELFGDATRLFLGVVGFARSKRMSR